MTGLQRILKMYGSTTVSANGKTVRWFWDYAQDCPAREDEMPKGSARWKESERAKYAAIKETMTAHVVPKDRT